MELLMACKIPTDISKSKSVRKTRELGKNYMHFH